jgi:hypothetical protein
VQGGGDVARRAARIFQIAEAAEQRTNEGPIEPPFRGRMGCIWRAADGRTVVRCGGRRGRGGRSGRGGGAGRGGVMIPPRPPR